MRLGSLLEDCVELLNVPEQAERNSLAFMRIRCLSYRRGYRIRQIGRGGYGTPQ